MTDATARDSRTQRIAYFAGQLLAVALLGTLLGTALAGVAIAIVSLLL